LLHSLKKFILIFRCKKGSALLANKFYSVAFMVGAHKDSKGSKAQPTIEIEIF
jgi:hypothetical protein